MTREHVARSGKAGPTAYSVTGQGAPVVLIHGVGMAREIWAPQVKDLSKSYQVICYDLLGHGQSDLPPAGVALNAYAEQLNSLLDVLRVESTYLVGHSMGALVALEFALSFRARTQKVAALNAVFERSAEQRLGVQDRAAALQREGPVASIEPTLERWFGNPIPTELQEAAQLAARLLRSVNPVGYARTYQLFANSDAVHATRLPGLKVPALFMTGEFDLNSSPSMSAAMSRLVPGSQFKVIAQARHMMNLTHPAQVTHALLDFLGHHPC